MRAENEKALMVHSAGHGDETQKEMYKEFFIDLFLFFFKCDL